MSEIIKYGLYLNNSDLGLFLFFACLCSVRQNTACLKEFWNTAVFV